MLAVACTASVGDVAVKVDLKKTIDAYRATAGEFSIIEVPELQYLMIDGRGDPNTAVAFAEAIETLYPVAYALKFASKRELERDYVVPPLEGLWWAENMDAYSSLPDRSQWLWTLMIMVPDWITRDLFATVVDRVRAKSAPARLDDVRFETLAEGRCVQTLHIGPFSAEAEVLARLHDEFIPAHGLTLAGKHHEIYFSDFRTVAPEKLRTILRQPVATA